MKKVWIIDDCEIISAAIEGALGADGIVCISCRSDEEYIKLISENTYSAVFIDLDIPGADSFELISLIRKKFGPDHHYLRIYGRRYILIGL